jgi:hypothetical protein
VDEDERDAISDERVLALVAKFKDREARLQRVLALVAKSNDREARLQKDRDALREAAMDAWVRLGRVIKDTQGRMERGDMGVKIADLGSLAKAHKGLARALRLDRPSPRVPS